MRVRRGSFGIGATLFLIPMRGNEVTIPATVNVGTGLFLIPMRGNEQYKVS